MRTFVTMMALAASMAACSDSGAADLATAPENNIAAGTLRITVAKSAYTRAELSEGIRGSVTNTSDQTFYANMGDAFNSAREQDPVFIALGSDGSLERADGSNWRTAETGILIEGTREIELRPGKTYSFITTVPQSTVAGTYRVTVAWHTTPGAQQASARASSATFEIR